MLIDFVREVALRKERADLVFETGMRRIQDLRPEGYPPIRAGSYIRPALSWEESNPNPFRFRGATAAPRTNWCQQDHSSQAYPMVQRRGGPFGPPRSAPLQACSYSTSSAPSARSARRLTALRWPRDSPSGEPLSSPPSPRRGSCSSPPPRVPLPRFSRLPFSASR